MLFAANHISYLDITVLGSLLDASFIAKTEVAGWPLFGWLARLQRSVFIDRRARSTAHQRDSIAARLAAGEALILFPEGTSGDGNRLLPFKSALFSVADQHGHAARRGDGAARVDRLYEARRDADRARAAAVFRLVRRDVAGAAFVADAGSGPARSRRRVPSADQPGRVRLAQGSGALLRGARRGGSRRRAERAARDAGAERRRRTALARRRLMPTAQPASGTRSAPTERNGFPPRRFTSDELRIVTKRLFIKTYGCQMNVYDSARMAELLAPLGYARPPAPDGADLVILNTCHIREKAAEKVFSELGAIRRLKTARERRGGQMVDRGRRLRRAGRGRGNPARARRLSISFSGRRPITACPRWSRGPSAAARQVLDTSFPAEPKFDHLPRAGRARARGSPPF